MHNADSVHIPSDETWDSVLQFMHSQLCLKEKVVIPFQFLSCLGFLHPCHSLSVRPLHHSNLQLASFPILQRKVLLWISWMMWFHPIVPARQETYKTQIRTPFGTDKQKELEGTTDYWLARAQSRILLKPYKSNKNWRWIQNPKLKKSKLLWRWTRAWPTLSSAQQEALLLPQTASPLSAKTGDDCDDDGWADLKSVCAFFFIFFSPVLFLFICFSPAWEAAPSPPPPSQAQLRQVSSTIDDIPCPYCWCLTTACPLWSFLSILLVADADQSWIQATSPRQSEGMMEIQPDDRGNESLCGNNGGSSIGNNGQKTVYNDGSNRADNDFVYESCCRWEPFVCHSFFWKDAKLRVWYSIVVSSYFMNRIPIELKTLMQCGFKRVPAWQARLPRGGMFCISPYIWYFIGLFVLS